MSKSILDPHGCNVSMQSKKHPWGASGGLEALEIKIMRPAAGLWRFRDDAAGATRSSESPIVY
jgi:hypothetical protein